MLSLLLILFVFSFMLETHIIVKNREQEFQRDLKRIERQERLIKKRLEFREFQKKIESIEINNKKEKEDDLFDFNELKERTRINIQNRKYNNKYYYNIDKSHININYDDFRNSLSNYKTGDIQVAFY